MITPKLCESCSHSMEGMDNYNRRRFCSLECYWKNPARGPARGMRQLKVRAEVSFDEDQFAEIRARAIKEQTSFAAQVRLLCEWGLEA